MPPLRTPQTILVGASIPRLVTTDGDEGIMQGLTTTGTGIALKAVMVTPR